MSYLPTGKSPAADPISTTIGDVLGDLCRHPYERLIRRWNWKAAILSLLLRSSIFFGVNLTAGWSSAVAALLTEISYRGFLAGFLGSLSQAFRRVQPAWQASVLIMAATPLLAHAVEFVVHSLRGTTRLYESIAVSVVFSMFSAVVNHFLQRRNLLVVGHEGGSFLSDVVSLPVVVVDLLVFTPIRRLAATVARPR